MSEKIVPRLRTGDLTIPDGEYREIDALEYFMLLACSADDLLFQTIASPDDTARIGARLLIGDARMRIGRVKLTNDTGGAVTLRWATSNVRISDTRTEEAGIVSVSLASGAGVVAHDAVAQADVVQQGHEARSSLRAAVAQGDAARGVADLRGRQIVAPWTHPEGQVADAAAQTAAATPTEVLAAPGAGLRIHLMGAILANHQAGAITGAIQCGGADRIPFELQASSTTTISIPVPYRGDENANWGFELDDAAASGVSVTLVGFVGP